MSNPRIPNVLVYVREKGGKRSFNPAPSIPDLTNCYWLRYEKNGGQAWQRVGHYDLVQREKLLLERRLSAAAQGFVLPEEQASQNVCPSRIKIQAALDAYLEMLRIKRRPSRTISYKKRDVGYFIASCTKTYMDEIESRDLLEFRDHQRAEEYSERTVYNHLMSVSTFLKKNGLYRITSLLEAEDWPEIPDTDPDPYTEEEMRKLIAAANDFERLVLRFFVGSGCREQEAAHVVWSDFDWIRKTVWIHAKPQYGWKPKTAAGTRRIPLSDALLADLKARQSTVTNPLVFPAKMGGIEGHFLRIFQGIGKLAGVSRVKCHRLRDTYLTDQLRAGTDLVTISKWAGHENLETLKLYPDALRDLDDAARAAANRQERYALSPQLVKTA